MSKHFPVGLHLSEKKDRKVVAWKPTVIPKATFKVDKPVEDPTDEAANNNLAGDDDLNLFDDAMERELGIYLDANSTIQDLD